MRLLNILYLQRIKLLFLLVAFLIALLTFSPVIRGGERGVFFSIDPDVVYVANALLYIKKGVIYMYVHPGTPAIRLIAQTLLPLRIYAKFVARTPFVDWVFINYSLVLYYLRMIMSLLLFISLYISFNAIFFITKKTISAFLLALGLLSYGAFYYLGVSISPDPFSFFTVSVWLSILTLYLSKENDLYLSFLFLVAGVSLAARATNIFLIPATGLLVLLENSFQISKRVTRLLKLSSCTAVGFIIGLWPLSRTVISDLTQTFIYGSSTGVHGSGSQTLYKLSDYITSAKSFLDRDFVATLIFLLIALLAFVSLFSTKTKFRKISAIILIFVIGAFAFAKFSLPHYQITNYYVVVFLGILLLSKYYKAIYLIAVPVLLITILPLTKNYLQTVSLAEDNSAYLENFIKDHPSRSATVWEWSRTKEFSYLWTRNYSSGIFDEQLSRLRPGLFQLILDQDKIRINNSLDKEIFDVCWDKMYIQQPSLETFLKLHPEFGNSVQKVPNGNMFLIESNHCQTTEL